MRSAKMSAVALCGVAAVVLALLCVAAVEAKALPNKLMPGATALTLYPGIGRYSIHAEARNWTDAHKTCTLENGHLAIIDSEEEAAILLGIMETNNKIYIHIGLHDSFGEGKFVSVRGQAFETLGYQTWGLEQPTGGVTYNYCVLGNVEAGATSNGFFDTTGLSLYPFICELPMWDDYDLIPGYGYYKVHNGPRTWKDSWETCRSEGAYLFLLSSTDERDLVVAKYLSVLSDYYVWYGAHQTFADQLYVTIFDEPLENSGFYSWVYGNLPVIPNTVYPYVALMVTPGDNNNLILFASTDQLPFICKYNLHDRA